MSFFTHDAPVSDRGHFYGRETVLRALCEGFVQQRSFLVCGGPRIGKTSVLQVAVAQIRGAWKRGRKEPRLVPVVIDLPELLKAGVRNVPQRLWERIQAAVHDPEVHGDTVPPTAERVDFLRTKTPWEVLRTALERYWTQLRGSAAWCEYGFVIDGGDLLLENRFEQVLDEIDKLAKLDAPWAPRSLIVAGGRPLRESIIDTSAPLHSLRPLTLGVLREDEAQHLLKAGLPEAPDDLVQSMLFATGRHPYALQRMLSELEQRGLGIGVDGAVDGAAPDCIAHFEDVWRSFDRGRGVTYRGAYAAPEHALMQLLIDIPSGLDLRMAERELGIRPLKEHAEFLEYVGVAERTLHGNDVQLRPQFDLWNVWYSERILR